MSNAPTKAYSRSPCFASGEGIICAGLPRTGTLSLATALSTLSITPVHHGLKMQNKRDFYAWARAGWCNMPNLRKARLVADNHYAAAPRYFAPYDPMPMLPWRRADWERLIGDYRATTDIAALFSEKLIRCYPEAKVILIERDVDRWMESMGELFIDSWLFGWHWLVYCYLTDLLGFPGGRVLSDISMAGFIGARTKK